jgi:hypothetical protein
MSAIVDKVKDMVGGGPPLSKGSKLPSTGLSKEDNPTEGSVDLSQLKGKSKRAAVDSVQIMPAERHFRRDRWCSRRFQPNMLRSGPRLHPGLGELQGEGRPGHLHCHCERCFHHQGVEGEAWWQG